MRETAHQKKLEQIWTALVGAPGKFSLEGRIFHAVCLIVLAGIVLNIPFNLWIGIPELAVLMAGLLLVVSAIYYFSRFKGHVKTCIVWFQVVNITLLILNYYFNSGMEGPSILIFLLSLVITISVISRRQYALWIPLNIFVILALMALERAYPHWIQERYDNADDRVFDFAYTYSLVAGLILFVTFFIRNSYHLERKLAKHRLLELERSNETKNKLLSIMAHDLKEPLSSIQGFLELLTEYKLDENERIDMEKQLLRRTQNASQMLINVLSWTKSQMEGISLNMQSVHLAPCLSNAIQIVRHIAAEKGITLEAELDQEICVYGDADMIQLVVRNLLMNAVKFTTHGGKVRLTACLQDKKCLIEVRDNGIGIPEAQQSKIFSLSEKPTFGTASEKGAGLGLVLCRNFVELQGGEIWFQSEPGVGSSFYVRLTACPFYLDSKIDSDQPKQYSL